MQRCKRNKVKVNGTKRRNKERYNETVSGMRSQRSGKRPGMNGMTYGLNVNGNECKRVGGMKTVRNETGRIQFN